MATNVDTKRQSHKISKITKQFHQMLLFLSEGYKTNVFRLIYLYQISARICDETTVVKRGQPH